MAIEKEIVKETGLKTKYHRILEVSVNYIDNTTNIKLVSYTDQKYRDQEKSNDKLVSNMQELLAQYNKSNDNEIKTSLFEKINELESSNNIVIDLNLIADEKIITLDYIPSDLCLDNLYTIISDQSEFEGSKGV